MYYCEHCEDTFNNPHERKEEIHEGYYGVEESCPWCGSSDIRVLSPDEEDIIELERSLMYRKWYYIEQGHHQPEGFFERLAEDELHLKNLKEDWELYGDK